jgi:hypothetical protein
MQAAHGKSTAYFSSHWGFQFAASIERAVRDVFERSFTEQDRFLDVTGLATIPQGAFQNNTLLSVVFDREEISFEDKHGLESYHTQASLRSRPVFL